MIKKMLAMACLLAVSSPIITQLEASPSSGHYYEFKGCEFQPSFEVGTLNYQGKKHHHNKKDEKCNTCCNTCEHKPRQPDIAYFYLRPDDVFEENRVILDTNPITWDPDVFTIKSKGIRIDEDDNTKIKFKHSGIYSITYTVFARPFETEGPVDWFTMELWLNSSPLAGSRFSQSTPIVEGGPDAVELVGQVITYIPANGRLQLFNVSGWPSNPVNIRLDNEGGRQGNVVSIAIERIASHVN